MIMIRILNSDYHFHDQRINCDWPCITIIIVIIMIMILNPDYHFHDQRINCGWPSIIVLIMIMILNPDYHFHDQRINYDRLALCHQQHCYDHEHGRHDHSLDQRIIQYHHHQIL